MLKASLTMLTPHCSACRAATGVMLCSFLQSTRKSFLTTSFLTVIFQPLEKQYALLTSGAMTDRYTAFLAPETHRAFSITRKCSQQLESLLFLRLLMNSSL